METQVSFNKLKILFFNELNFDKDVVGWRYIKYKDKMCIVDLEMRDNQKENTLVIIKSFVYIIILILGEWKCIGQIKLTCCE